jgi:YidC/Oxa1 family membrane protein insertase
MDNNNLIIAVVLSLLILFGFQYFYAKPAVQQAQENILDTPVTAPKTVDAVPSTLHDRAAIIKSTARVAIATPELRGSINTKGARLDDLELIQYHETVDPKSPPVTLLSPAGTAAPGLPYYADIGWLADGDITVPTSDTVWHTANKNLTPTTPVTLTWDNSKGLKFERTISVDDHYMFTIIDRVKNIGATTATLYPFGSIARQGLAVEGNSRILHEGPIGSFNGTLEEYTYKKLMENPKKSIASEGGWLGITDKYWLVAMALPETEKLTGAFAYNSSASAASPSGVFQADFRSMAMSIVSGASITHTTQFFAGAKRQSLLEDYRDAYKIPLFDRAIDFGWFWFLTIPFLHFLNLLSRTLGSYAFAILTFTVMLKLVTLPLTLKSSHSMSRMKTLQPMIKQLQERFKDDKVRQSQEMMELYKREKISPLSGCLPTLIQIPIFFALYKVLYVGIEMRQAPFYGWIHDLSMPDPTSLFTLFGLVPWTPPSALHIGIWPLLMGCSMFLQQRLSPQPTADKSQAQMFAFMPVLFTWMLRGMPAGLVIYWTWSNLLSILQQWYIMRQDAKRQTK